MRFSLLCFILLWSPLSLADNLYPFENAKQTAQFHYLLKELRCLVCQNQDLADSNASLARDLRGQVYHMVREGQSDQKIIQYLTKRYGDFILFKPPLKSVTALLWLGPLLFLGLGFWVFFCSIRVRRGVSSRIPHD